MCTDPEWGVGAAAGDGSGATAGPLPRLSLGLSHAPDAPDRVPSGHR